MLLLTATSVAYYNVSIPSGTQDVSRKDLTYGSSLAFILMPKSTTLDSGIYNVINMATEMVKDNNTTAANSTQASDPRDNAVITMQRHGTANRLFPVYSLTIYGNGSVIYNGIKNVDTTGAQTYQIPKDRARELVNTFINIYYFALKEKYSDSSNASTSPVVTTSININGKTKTVLDDHSSYAPPTLRALEDMIDQIANSKQWIKLH